MIKIQIKKRNISLEVMVLFLAILLLIFFQVRRFIDLQKGTAEYSFVMLILIVLYFIQSFFRFKAFFHWSKGKGYHGSLSLLAMLGFPIGFIIMACLKDQVPPLPTTETKPESGAFLDNAR